MERGKHKVELVSVIGQTHHNGRTYKVVREKIVGTGDEYNAIKLYNARGKFIKRFMIEPAITAAIGHLLSWSSTIDALNEAEEKAWKALARYKFQMFGYWAAVWVHLNRVSGAKRKNPFTKLVTLAKNHPST